MSTLPLTFFLFLLLLPNLHASQLPFLSRQQQCPVVLQLDPPARIAQSSSLAVRQPRIVGGAIISDRLRPALVALRATRSNGICSGSLISPQWIITAAHCGVTTSWVAAVGSESALSGNGLPIRFAVGHPRFSANNGYDIALVQLASPVSSSLFMAVNVNDSNPVPISFARVMGYGVTEFNSPDPASSGLLLRQVDVPISVNAVCQRTYLNLDFRKQLCAGYPDGGCDSCQGDSGGPLIQYDEQGNPVQVGIVSFGAECARPNAPGVYVRTSAHIAWMRQQGAEFTESSSTNAVFSSIANRGVDDSGTNTPLIIGAAAGGAALIAVVLIGIAFVVNKTRAHGSQSDVDPALYSASLMPLPAQAPSYPPNTQYPTHPINAYHPGVQHAPVHHSAIQTAQPFQRPLQTPARQPDTHPTYMHQQPTMTAAVQPMPTYGYPTGEEAEQIRPLEAAQSQQTGYSNMNPIGAVVSQDMGTLSYTDSYQPEAPTEGFENATGIVPLDQAHRVNDGQASSGNDQAGNLK